MHDYSLGGLDKNCYLKVIYLAENIELTLNEKEKKGKKEEVNKG